ncbi:hypothetical protein CBM2592_A280130 [Cupriavidus taiwanensis]|nr:hypothetical protein CBM2592_A280130 [Cupriavidus taiwanensis]
MRTGTRASANEMPGAGVSLQDPPVS